METYIYLVEVYKYENNYREMQHYTLNAYKTKEKAIKAIKDIIKIYKTDNDNIIKGNDDNCIGGLRNTLNNESKLYWINEIQLKG